MLFLMDGVPSPESSGAVEPAGGEEGDESIILISDDEAESSVGSSVLFVQPQEEPALGEVKAEVVDEESELMVTFCKEANVMPHARYDCSKHPFERTESDTCSPLGENAAICDQCYCYICDKLASECQQWTTPSLCHCNAHNKSRFWKERRGFTLAGVLATFDLELSDIDADLRHGGSLLVNFMQELSVEYNKYLTGERIYPPQHECFCVPKLPPGECSACRSRSVRVVYKSWHNLDHTASLKIAVPCLFQRITTQLQRMLVLCDFPRTLNDKIINFFHSICLPCHCFGFSNSLKVLSWNHVLLTTVLKGQNITGHRRQKGRKMCLWETLPVIEARVEKLVEKKNYREVIRYLKAVKCNDTKGYSEVFALVTRFLNQAEQESPKAAAVMLLGAAKEIAAHKDPSLSWHNLDHTASLKIAVPCLFQRITTQLQRMLVLCDFPRTLNDKIINFFHSICLPCHCFGFSNSLKVLSWNHVLLTTVLKGQNITGHRRQKGRKMCLWETLPVIEARVEKLVEKKNYREVIRYLKAVKCNDTKGLRDLQDKIPFFLCKIGNFAEAAQAQLFPVKSIACCSACRISPCQYKLYLKMFKTGSVPSGDDMLQPGPWVSAGKCHFLLTWPPLGDGGLTKQALRLIYSNTSLYRNPTCWSSLIMVVGSSNVLNNSGQLQPLTLKQPPLDFQQKVLADSESLLEELKANVNVSLPRNLFSPELLQEACLILAVQAVLQMLFCDLSSLTSFLEIALAFGNNFWALRLLLDHLSYEENVLRGTVRLILNDLSREKAAIIKLWEDVGPQYVGQFLWLFLTCRHKKMQSVGLFTLGIIAENLHSPTAPLDTAMDEWDLPQWKKEVESLKYQLAYKREMSSKTIPEFVKWIEDGIPEDPFLNPELMKNNPWVEKGKCTIL
ncbi:hypothetical protein WISP_37472 [Willisornis vidua]|nr:hypothetical protein WISP_37472 [Willisornis vidua]